MNAGWLQLYVCVCTVQGLLSSVTVWLEMPFCCPYKNSQHGVGCVLIIFTYSTFLLGGPLLCPGHIKLYKRNTFMLHPVEAFCCIPVYSIPVYCIPVPVYLATFVLVYPRGSMYG